MPISCPEIIRKSNRKQNYFRPGLHRGLPCSSACTTADDEGIHVPRAGTNLELGPTAEPKLSPSRAHVSCWHEQVADVW